MATQLVALPPIERLSPRCLRILGGNPGKFTLQGTNTYLLGTGRQRILIDTGEGRPAWIASLKETLEKENATVTTALITHWHDDHTGGIRDLLKLCPEAQIYKHDPKHGQHDIIDGQTFSEEGVNLTATYSPGHTSDHMVFLLPEEDAMFTADNVLGQGTAVFEDLSTYLASLDKMRNLFRGRAYPGHGPVLEDGPAKITEYIYHRQQREEQVIRTLRSSRNGAAASDAWTPMELVKVIYHDVPESLHMAACGGVKKILEKLRGEGRTEEDGGRWRMRDRPTL